MRRRTFLFAIMLIMTPGVFCAGTNGYASAEQEKEKQEARWTAKDDSIFQKLGDFITGKYEVNGKPIKKTGIFQPVADEVKKMENAPVR